MKKKDDTKPLKEKMQKCGICLKLKKRVCFHSKDSCWFKTKENNENETH